MGRMPSKMSAFRIHTPRLLVALVYTPPLRPRRQGEDAQDCRNARARAIKQGVEFVIRLEYEHLNRAGKTRYDRAKAKHNVVLTEHDIIEPNWWLLADRLTVHLDEHEYVIKWLYKPAPEC